jgi:hypothetical protein
MLFKRLRSGFPDVSALSQRARLAIALHLFRGYGERRGLAHPEIERYLDHLWEFVGLCGDGEAFGRWIKREPALTYVGLGDDYPQEFAEYLTQAAVPLDEFRYVLESCTEVVYISMYGAADDNRSAGFLLDLAHTVAPLGVPWPDLERFAASRWADEGGWGQRPSAQELAHWRL